MVASIVFPPRAFLQKHCHWQKNALVYLVRKQIIYCIYLPTVKVRSKTWDYSFGLWTDCCRVFNVEGAKEQLFSCRQDICMFSTHFEPVCCYIGKSYCHGALVQVILTLRCHVEASECHSSTYCWQTDPRSTTLRISIEIHARSWLCSWPNMPS